MALKPFDSAKLIKVSELCEYSCYLVDIVIILLPEIDFILDILCSY